MVKRLWKRIISDMYIIPISQGTIISKIYNRRKILFTFFTIFLNSSRLGGISVQKDYIRIALIKFIYSEKATKFCETFTILLTGTA